MIDNFHIFGFNSKTIRFTVVIFPALKSLYTWECVLDTTVFGRDCQKLIRQVSYFLGVLRYYPAITLTAMI